MKHAKALLAVVLSAAMVGQSIAPVYADTSVDDTPKSTFHYVAIGDSIGSGYAIETNTALENYHAAIPHLNYDNCPPASYPALVANSLASILTEQGRIQSEDDLTYANLGMAAYRIENYIELIDNPDYILPSYVGTYWTNYANERERYETIDHAELEPMMAASNKQTVKYLMNAYYFSEDPDNDAAYMAIVLEMYYGLRWKSPEEFRAWAQDILFSEEAFDAWFDAWHKDYFQNVYPRVIYAMDSKFHNTFVQELQKADLITIDVGSNNLLGAYLGYLGELAVEPDAQSFKDPATGITLYDKVRNPILLALSTVFYMGVLGGGQVEFSDVALLIPAILAYYRDQLTIDHVVETLKCLTTTEMLSVMSNFVKVGADKLPELTEKVVEINHNAGKDADIALIGHYGAMGNSLKVEGTHYDFVTVAQIILRDAVQILFEEEGESAENPSLNASAANLSEEQILAGVKNYDDTFAQLEALLADEGEEALSSTVLAEGSDDTEGEGSEGEGTEGEGSEGLIPESLLNSKAYKLIMRLIKDLQYPIVYVAVGYPSKLAIQEFNSRIQEYAEENGYLYVDVYDIPNDERSDPHPTSEGHQYIADKILDVLKEQYVPQEEPVEPAEEPAVDFPVLNLFLQAIKTLHNVHSALHSILSPRRPSVLPFRQAMYGRSR